MNDTRYLYEVRPVRPIIISGKSIRIPCSIQLTKAEVLEYMKSAAIYRRFANSEPVRVTGENLDALHQQTYNPNYKSVVSVPTFVVSKEDTITPHQEPEKTTPVVDQKSEEEENAGKKLKEEESSVISSETSEDHNAETPATEKVSETAKNDEETTEAPEESVVNKEDEVQQPVQPAAVPSINLKNNNGNKNQNQYNNGNKNYKK